ncbi:MAG: hypothetical protein LBS36_10665 [Oscillospiraceae bacterium]|jgi:hypothetical protein|nr:hypothetical protein [Oscillospiraceae bacterium]
MFTISGSQPVLVTKTSGSDKITYNALTNKLDIAAGLPKGNYPVTLKASNGTLPDATFSFTLTVGDNMEPNPPDPAQKIELISGTVLHVKGSFLFFANGTTASTFLAQIKTSCVNLYGTNGKKLADNSLVGTGAVLKLEQGGTLLDSYTVIMLGDLDGDGKTTAGDARTALRISAKLEMSADVQILAADADDNGNITASDARSILRVSAKLDNASSWLEKRA